MCSHTGLVKIKEARDIETKLNEVERLLKNAINMPWKVRDLIDDTSKKRACVFECNKQETSLVIFYYLFPANSLIYLPEHLPEWFTGSVILNCILKGCFLSFLGQKLS